MMLPTKANHRGYFWTWDFIADATVFGGGALRMLTILDEHTRECHVLRADRALRSANGYHGPEIKDHGQTVAESLATAGCGCFGWRDEDLGALPKGDERKALIASLIHRETTVPLDWISAKLRMGVRADVCRSIKRHRELLKTDSNFAGVEQEIMSRIYA